MNLESTAATKLVGGASLLLVSAVGWLGLLGPSTSTLADMQEQTASASAQNQVLQTQLLLLQEQAVRLAATRRTAGALSARFPPTADQPGLFTAVTTAASDAGILPRNVKAVTPSPPTVASTGTSGDGEEAPGEGSDGLARQTLTVTVEATYDATRELLARLEQMPRAFLVASVAVAAGTSPTTYSSTVTGDMFVMPPTGDVKRVADQLDTTP
jgi:hypothetical protein